MDNPIKKDESCQETQLNVGADVTAHCPPELTPRVKAALEAEITSFQNKEVQEETRKQIESSAVGGANSDAYSNWVSGNGGEEPIEANPDVLSEKRALKFIRPEMSHEEVSFLREIRQFFSARELQVWNMVMAHGMTQQQCADLLQISIKSVEVYLRRAQDKFAKFVEERKNG